MTALKVFILAGTIDSHDGQFVTVELDTKADCPPALIVLPVADFPCEVKEGRAFYLVKLSEMGETVTVCEEEFFFQDARDLSTELSK